MSGPLALLVGSIERIKRGGPHFLRDIAAKAFLTTSYANHTNTVMGKKASDRERSVGHPAAR